MIGRFDIFQYLIPTNLSGSNVAGRRKLDEVIGTIVLAGIGSGLFGNSLKLETPLLLTSSQLVGTLSLLTTDTDAGSDKNNKKRPCFQ